MYEWFYNPDSSFHMWGTTHLITIFLTLVLISALFVFRKSLTAYRRKIRLTVGWTLLISRLSLDFWYIVTDQWSAGVSLPFELCSIASIMSAIMLLTKNRHLFEIFYFIAIGGAVQAILTPDLAFGFPQYRYMQFFLDHTFLIMAPLILISLYGFTITFKSLVKSFVALNAIAAVVYVINVLLSANYMFLRHKPGSASILDFLGPYPYYIISLEIVALVMFVILYLPFALKQLRRF